MAIKEKIDYVELMRYIENTHPTIEVTEDEIDKRKKAGLLDEDEPEVAFE